MSDPTIHGGSQTGLIGVGTVTATSIVINNYADPRSAAEQTDTQAIAPCPYPGLAYFGPNDAELFFGRDKAIDELAKAVMRQSLTALVGASGSGKSSVVLAGLAPWLHQNGGWLFSYFRIGHELDRNPFVALARALVPFYVQSKTETQLLVEIEELAEKLASGKLLLRQVFAASRKQHAGHRILLIADQFEEVFTLVEDEAVRNHFIDVLLSGFLDPSPGDRADVCLVITLRADFYGRALRYRPLSDALQRHVENLGPLTRSELEVAIVEPAKKAKTTFEPGLVQTLLDDVERRPGSLPLLQFALREMWGRQRSSQITRDSYDDLGGVEGALAMRAEAIFSRLTGLDPLTRRMDRPEVERDFRLLFTRLVRLGEGQEDTRRVVARNELGDTAWPLAQRLAGEENRLLVTNAPVEPAKAAMDGGRASRETVEVVHEALIRQWPRLVEWIDRDRAFQSWLAQIRSNVDVWLKDRSDESPLLRGGMLAQGVEWLAKRGGDLNAEEQDYIQACIDLQRREEEQKEAGNKRLKRLATVLAVIAVMTILFAWFAEQERRRADQLSRVALSRQLAAQSVSELDRRVDRALLLSLASAQMTPTLESKDSLLRSIESLPRRLSFLWGHQDPVHRLAFSPDGKTLASASEKGAVIFWDVPSRQLLGEPPPEHTYQVDSLAFSADGKRLVSAALDEFGIFGGTHGAGNAHVVIWDVASRAPLGGSLRISEENTVDAIALSPDGKMFAVASRKGEEATVAVWDVDKRTRVGERIRVDQGSITKIAFSPDGMTFALANTNGEVVLWDAVRWRRSGETLQVRAGRLASLTFSADGSMLAVATESGYGTQGKKIHSHVTLWNVANRTLVGELPEGEQLGVANVAFSPDVRTLALATWEETVVLWDISTRKASGNPLVMHRGPVSSITFSPNGKTIATGSWDNTVILWDVNSANPMSEALEGLQEPVHSVAFSADGETLTAAAFPDRYVGRSNTVSVRRWAMLSRAPLGEQLRLSHSGDVEKVVLGPGGGTLAVAGSSVIGLSSPPAGGFVSIWDMANGAALGQPMQLFPDWLAFAPGGNVLAVAGWWSSERATRVGLVDAARGAPLSEPFRVSEHRSGGIAFSPNGQKLAVADGEVTITLWDVAAQARSGEPFRGGQAYGLMFSQDGKTLAAPNGTTVRLWDVDSRHPLGEPLEGARVGIETIAISPHGHLLAAADGPRVWLWDMPTRTSLGKPLRNARGLVHGLAFSPDGKTLASGQDEGVTLWDLNNEHWQALACYAANRNLTREEWSRFVGDTVAYTLVCPGLPAPNR